MFISTDALLGTMLYILCQSLSSICAKLKISQGLCLRTPTCMPGLRNPILFIQPPRVGRKVFTICFNLPGLDSKVHEPVTDIVFLNFK
jgi:hypothetical protein